MLAIKGGKILTVTNGEIKKGNILIENGKIVAVGDSVEIPKDAKVIDADGKWITPGLIDVHTHISVKEEPSAMPKLGDTLENTDPVTPYVRAIDSLNPFDSAIEAVRDAGFTTCCTLPGSGNLIGGQSVVFKTKVAETVMELVIPGKEQMKMALGENPRRIHGTKGKSPRTRLGNGAVLREALFKAKVYSDKLKEAETDPSKAPTPDFRLDPLVPVVRGEMKCRIHSHRADDIVTATRIADEFGLKYTIEHVTEGWKIINYLKEKNVTCVVGPHDMGPYKLEVWNRRLDNAVFMEEAGINFCITQDACSGTRFLPSFIGMIMARGLSFEAALASVTINAAKLLDIDDRVGSIEVGKDADLAIFSGHPFSNFTLCDATIIDGVVYEHKKHII